MAVRKKAPARKKAPLKKSAPRKAVSKAKAKAAPPAKATPKAKAASKPAVASKPSKPTKGKARVAVAAAVKAPPAKAPKAQPAAKPAKASKPKASPARDALKAHAMKKAIERVIAPIESETAVVDAYMRDLDHPFKGELEALRAIILGASDKLSERIKWNAPSFFYKEHDLAAFHPRATEYAHLIVLFPGGAGVPAKSALLEGKAKDRREAKFHSLEDIQSKKRALEKLVKEWVALRDA